MPKFDGTGPQGAGPMTGRGFGPCANRASGFGRGFGRGGGFCKWFGLGNRQLTKDEELADTKGYIQNLKAELKEAEDYIKNLEDSK